MARKQVPVHPSMQVFLDARLGKIDEVYALGYDIVKATDRGYAYYARRWDINDRTEDLLRVSFRNRHLPVDSQDLFYARKPAGSLPETDFETASAAYELALFFSNQYSQKYESEHGLPKLLVEEVPVPYLAFDQMLLLEELREQERVFYYEPNEDPYTHAWVVVAGKSVTGRKRETLDRFFGIENVAPIDANRVLVRLPKVR